MTGFDIFQKEIFSSRFKTYCFMYMAHAFRAMKNHEKSWNSKMQFPGMEKS